MPLLKRSSKAGSGHYTNEKIDRLRKVTLSETTQLSSDARDIAELFRRQVRQIKDEKLKSSLAKKSSLIKK